MLPVGKASLALTLFSAGSLAYGVMPPTQSQQQGRARAAPPAWACRSCGFTVGGEKAGVNEDQL